MKNPTNHVDIYMLIAKVNLCCIVLLLVLVLVLM